MNVFAGGMHGIGCCRIVAARCSLADSFDGVQQQSGSAAVAISIGPLAFHAARAHLGYPQVARRVTSYWDLSKRECEQGKAVSHGH